MLNELEFPFEIVGGDVNVAIRNQKAIPTEKIKFKIKKGVDNYDSTTKTNPTHRD